MRRTLLVVGLATLTLAVAFRLRSGAGGGVAARAPAREGRAVYLTGSPREKGRAHGRLLRDDIRALFERSRPADEGVAQFAIRTCGERILPALPDDIRAELEGIAEGAALGVHEVLFLNTRFELAGHGLVALPERFDAPVAVAADGPVVFCGRLDAAPLLLLIHEDHDPPLVLLGLPGMVGGFAAVRGGAAASLRPMPSETRPVLTGAPWPVLLRRLVEDPPTPGGRLPLPATRVASVAMVRPDGEVGTLNLSPAGATWYAGFEGRARSSDEPVTGEDNRIAIGRRSAARRLAEGEAAARLLKGRSGLFLRAGAAGVELAFGDVSEVVRFRR